MERAAPGCTLAVIYFAKVDFLPLNDPLIGHSRVFNNTPVAVFFTVLKSLFSPQKHSPIFRDKIKTIKVIARRYKRFQGIATVFSIG
jgi:hypothetical protein